MASSITRRLRRGSSGRGRPSILAAAVTLLLALPLHAQTVYKGTSMYFAGYLEDVCGVEYREGGVPTDPFQTLAGRGANIVRAALHMEPFANAYTAGRPDVDWGSPNRVLETLSRAQSHGMEAFLTIGYDSYADVGAAKENPYAAPPTWRDLATNESVLRDSIYAYTDRSVRALLRAGVTPSFVAIGNEINWRFMEPNVPEGQLGTFNAARKVRLLNEGARAVRDLSAEYGVDMRVVMHIFEPSALDWWLRTHAGLDFDVMGVSFYYSWHSMGSFADFTEVAEWLRDRHGKDFMLLETAQVWTSGWSDGHNNILTANEAIPPGYPRPPSTVTQRTYMTDVTREVAAGGGLGTIYWGGDSVGHDCYIYPDQWGTGSAWEDKAFWDFDRNAHAGMDWMSETYVSTSAQLSPREAAALDIFPQPAGEDVVVRGLPPSAARLSLWSIDGRRVLRADSGGRLELRLETRKLASGVYFLRIEWPGGSPAHHPVLIQR